MAIRKIVARSIGVDVITAEDLADNSITAAEITNGAVTADKLASNSVTTAKIAAGVTLTSPVINTITSAAATALTLQSAGITAITVDTSQNVGIGTASPTAKFNVFGTNQVLSNPAGTANDSNGFDTTTFSSSTPHWSYLSYNASHFQWSTYNVERMRIDSSGNLLVGTAASTGGIVESKSTTAGGECYRAWNSATTGTRYFHYFGVGTSFTNVGAITSTGSATVFATTSDYRLKEDVTPMTGALATIAKLKPCNYKWIADGSDGQGFIAHEIQEVLPECVVGEKDAVDDKGNPEHQMVDASFLVATLTAAIQELKVENDALKARLDAAGL